MGKYIMPPRVRGAVPARISTFVVLPRYNGDGTKDLATFRANRVLVFVPKTDTAREIKSHAGKRLTSLQSDSKIEREFC